MELSSRDIDKFFIKKELELERFQEIITSIGNKLNEVRENKDIAWTEDKLSIVGDMLFVPFLLLAEQYVSKMSDSTEKD